MTEILASELKEDAIDVNAVAPGAVNTDMLDEILNAKDDVTVDEYKSALNRKKNGGESPSQITKLCQFLLSPSSNGISGKLLSASWDPWGSEIFQKKLKNEKDFAMLRRIDDRNFYKLIKD